MELTNSFPLISLSELGCKPRLSFSVPWHLKPRHFNNERYRYEMEVIAMLCQHFSPCHLFEFGTFEGFTTLVMGRNVPDSSIVYTLDLTRGISPPADYDCYNASFITCRYHLYFEGQPESNKIIRLVGDSLEFDIESYRKAINFIFVDGCHDKKYITNDTNKALEMLAPGGVILWHDYGSTWPDVTPFLDRLALNFPMWQIKGTSFAIYVDKL